MEKHQTKSKVDMEKYQMNIDDYHVLRTILLVSQLLSWEQCPVHFNFV